MRMGIALVQIESDACVFRDLVYQTDFKYNMHINLDIFFSYFNI